MKKIFTNPIFLGTLVLILSLVEAGLLTKMGVIPNYLNLDILCPGENANNNSKGYDYDDDLPGGFPSNPKPGVSYKPVIYFYPKKEENIKVVLNYSGQIIADYPKFDNSFSGWNIKAFPDGKVIDLKDNKEYSYIFWEGKSFNKIDWNLDKGFVVKGSETKDFLQKKLAEMGLTPKEYNEFVVYWFPLMQNNEYNFINFSTDQYEKLAPLSINPKPDSILRVFMVYKPLKKYISISEQNFQKFERKGFSVVEWGGTKSE